MKITKSICFVAAALGMFVLAQSANAQIIANYDFNPADGGTTGPGSPASIVDPVGATAGDVSVGAGLNPTFVVGSGENILGGNANNFGFSLASVAGEPTTLANAIAVDDFISFTITPDAGQQIEFTTFDFQVQLNALSNSLSTYSLFSSVDGFAEADAIQTVSAASAGSLISVDQIDLSGLGPVTSATEFRLYVYDVGVTTNGNTGTNFENFVLQGNITPTSVPEPGSLAVLALGGVLTLVRRKKR